MLVVMVEPSKANYSQHCQHISSRHEEVNWTVPKRQWQTNHQYEAFDAV